MSVLLECQPGDEFICVQEFHASPDGESFSWSTSRHFQVGERLRYMGWRRNTNLNDHPSEWLVVFEAADGKGYAATQTYFVTTECWEGINKFVSQQLLRALKRQSTPSQE